MPTYEEKTSEKKVAKKTYIICIAIALVVAVIATVISLVILGLDGSAESPLDEIVIGILAGLAYYVSFMIFQRKSKKKG
ncbi:MAG: hypothetical protein FWG14_09390 [Peptococcaceae bacterium]|nr:hypothetical protein [Peptococcaceae bacterium]